MKPLIVLIASDGGCVLPDSPQFSNLLGDLDPDYDSVAFAVTNLGFIKVEMFEQASLEIELHPRNVEQRWPGESGQWVKWIFCLRAAQIAADQERA